MANQRQGIFWWWQQQSKRGKKAKSAWKCSPTPLPMRRPAPQCSTRKKGDHVAMVAVFLAECVLRGYDVLRCIPSYPSNATAIKNF
jgi:hypothetical protein